MSEKAAAVPPKYLEWLAQLGKQPRVMFDDIEWELAPPKQLAKAVSIDGQKAPFIEQTRLYVATLKEFMPELEDGDGRPVAFERVEQFLTIGEQNEELLCVDPSDKFSVWTFMPGEGGMLDRVAKSLEAFMKKATAPEEE